MKRSKSTFIRIIGLVSLYIVLAVTLYISPPTASDIPALSVGFAAGVLLCAFIHLHVQQDARPSHTGRILIPMLRGALALILMGSMFVLRPLLIENQFDVERMFAYAFGIAGIIPFTYATLKNY